MPFYCSCLKKMVIQAILRFCLKRKRNHGNTLNHGYWLRVCADITREVKSEFENGTILN